MDIDSKLNSNLYRILASVIFLAVLMFCTIVKSPIRDETLRVMTFNIRYGTADDKENSWQNRKSLVFDVIKEFAPDILGLQEALHFQLEELNMALPNYDQVGVGRDDGKKKGEYTAVLYNSERFEILKEGTFWFSDTPDVPGTTSFGNDIPRICTWAYLKESATDSAFYIYNVHWDHKSQTSREKSAELLISKILNREKRKAPFILMGDFNVSEDNPAFLALTGNRVLPIKDSYRELYPKAENTGTFNGFTGKTDGPKIDAILVSDMCRTVTADILRTNKEGRYPSDHFPVTAVIKLIR